MEERNNDEITVKELIVAIIGHWRMIAVFMVSALLIVLVYLFVFTKPVYNAETTGKFNAHESIDNKYGTYTFQSTNIMDYINVAKSNIVIQKTIDELGIKTTIDSVADQLAVTASSDLTEFSIVAKADTPEKASALVKKISEVFMNELKIRYREDAIKTFLAEYKLKNEKLSEDLQKADLKLERLEADLAEVSPVITLKKLLISDPDLAALIANKYGLDLSHLTDEDVLYEEAANPSYAVAADYVFSANKTAVSFRVDLERNMVLYNEIIASSEGVKIYKETGDISGLDNTAFDILDKIISITNNDNNLATQVSSNKTMALAIALLMGLILGAITALIKHYWGKMRTLPVEK